MAVPVFLLIARRAGNLCFYALFLLALAAMVLDLRPCGKKFSQLLKEHWPLHLAMAGMLLAVLINQLALLDFAGRSYDYPSRMAFFAFLLWAALLVPYRLMKQLQWAYVAGALLAAVKMYIITDGGVSREYVDFMPIIEFGQLSLLLGFFAVLSLAYEEKSPALRRVGIGLKLLAGCGGLYAAYLSQTRGAWLGIPLFLLIAIAILGNRVHARKQFAIAVALLAIVTVLFGSTGIVRSRVLEARQSLVQYIAGENPDTSVGIRLQLWKGSWLLFKEHAGVGVGREHFTDALGDLERRRVITHQASIQPHSHDEILYNMVTLGMPGLIAILALYLVPAFYFWRETRHPDAEIRATAGMGLILCSGFLILGLVDVMFMWGVCDNFYGMFAAIFFAFIIRRKHELADWQVNPVRIVV